MFKSILAIAFLFAVSVQSATKLKNHYVISEDKPATVSSSSDQDHPQRVVDTITHRQDADCACFSSNEEKNPWIIIDLLGKYEISSVIITSSPKFGDNFQSIQISMSQNKKNWIHCDVPSGKLDPTQAYVKECQAHGVRYIRVRRKTKKDVLAVCEVTVRGIREPYDEEDILLSNHRPAFQSSTKNGAVAARAVDNNTYRKFSGGSCTKTKYQKDAWWYVDLGRTYSIDYVNIYNRKNSKGQLSNFDVCYKKHWKSKWKVCKFFTGTVRDGQRVDIKCNRNARYIMIRKSGKGRLSMCEVRVWGYLYY